MKNFGGESFGRMDLRRATGQSVNTIYAELNIEVGAKNSMKAASDAGVRSTLQPNVGNVLGTDYVTVLDMASAYATIAAEGVRANPYIVKEIRFLDEGIEPITVKPVTKKVFDKDLMSDVIDAMTYPVEGGSARYVGQNLNRPAAGKTGTSESFRSAWFDGFVPQLATAVGLYRSGPDGEELKMENLPDSGDITGGSYPTRIWTAYMKAALDGTKVERFPEPANINKDAKYRPTRTSNPSGPTTTRGPSTTAPPSTPTSAGPSTVMSGISALRSAWTNQTALPASPLARAVRM